MADDFRRFPKTLEGPALSHFAITPHNSNNETKNFRSIYVGGAGDVVIVTEDGTAVTYKNAAAGSVIPVRGKRVNDTGTTATNLVGMY